MYKELKSGEEFEVFDLPVISRFFDCISDDIDDLCKRSDSIGPCIVGAFALEDVPMADGGKTNVWVEYNGDVIPPGIVDGCIQRIIIYDDIPDIILDRYNEFKATIKN